MAVARIITHTEVPQPTPAFKAHLKVFDFAPLPHTLQKKARTLRGFCDHEHLKQEENRTRGTETPTIPHTDYRCQTNKCQTSSSHSGNNEARQAKPTMTRMTFSQDETRQGIRAYERRAKQRGRSTRSRFTPPKGFTSPQASLSHCPTFSCTQGNSATRNFNADSISSVDCSHGTPSSRPLAHSERLYSEKGEYTLAFSHSSLRRVNHRDRRQRRTRRTRLHATAPQSRNNRVNSPRAPSTG